MRVAIYARYSSDQQRATSLQDQVALCREHAGRQGWQVVQVYSDAAISGGSAARPGYQQMLADAGKRRFDVVLAEAIDRLGRRLADVADFHDRLTFFGVQLHTVSQGEITPMHTAVMGMVAQQYLADLRDKTRRGQHGRARAGRTPGGLGYGYRVVAADPDGAGRREIEASEAAVVRRIFRLYADGMSPRAIARRLNAEAVPGPGGRPWQDTTIRGQVERGTGILNNTAYVGRLSWNRCAYVKDPRSGRRIARPNPPADWVVLEVPELRILEDDLWNAVKARQETSKREMARDDAGNALNRVHRRKFLLSGLLHCGCCGARYTVMAQDRYGCAGRRNRGTCENSSTVLRAEIEARVWRALKERMMAPGLVAEFTRTFQEETRRVARESRERRQANERELATLRQEIDRLIDAIARGAFSPTLRDRLEALERRRADLEAGMPEEQPPTVALPPRLDRLYARKLQDLEALIDDPELSPAAMEAVRGLITRIDLAPRKGGGVAATVYGDLAEMIALASGEDHKADDPRREAHGGQLSVVAGAGFEPATFRL